MHLLCTFFFINICNGLITIKKVYMSTLAYPSRRNIRVEVGNHRVKVNIFLVLEVKVIIDM